MLHNHSRLVLIAILCATLIKPARAESIDTAGKQIYAGIAVVGAAVAIGIIFIVLHEKHKARTITGCVASGAGAMTLTDDKDKQAYTLSGNPAGIKPGDRMMLDGKRRGKIFDTNRVIKDLGPCQP